MAGKAWRQECEVSGHVVSAAVRKQRLQLTFSFPSVWNPR